MVSKSKIKLIKSLSQKKQRHNSKMFVAEGKKVIAELLESSFQLELLWSTEDCFKTENGQTEIVSESDLKKVSFLTTPQTALAIFRFPDEVVIKSTGLIVALDGVRDPGNLGTIIRMCDWFGVDQLVCSQDTVDAYNPKVVQATMGSISRVEIIYTDLPHYLKDASKKETAIFGTFMDSENVYQKRLPENAILVMGNEANGISNEIEKLVTRKISIPQFGDQQETESLNVATATAILLSEFKRGTFTEK